MRNQIIAQSPALQQIHSPEGADQVRKAAGPAQGFEDTLRGLMSSVNETQHRSEAVTDAYQRGEITDVAKVMLARQESGIAFEATLQTRNKLLNAYQEIMRMGV
ncbi:flagellar hook-basal body complex protein FliE [Croceicoccus gelatinilyticus]|uniref:flagellar hook-basal body complex protein FliE n=1 Tax=Croceicoccus gelatinilyticus TaxID=2835536 RepID=UPI001CECB123|nr:flagellar hook-basal body complex protein FliE [Croceicoccus gelatinilyticus]